jgi:hypothetical protein
LIVLFHERRYELTEDVVIPDSGACFGHFRLMTR